MCGVYDNLLLPNKFLHMFFSKIMKTSYDLLFTRSNFEWLRPRFFTINLFFLINGDAVLLYHNRSL